MLISRSPEALDHEPGFPFHSSVLSFLYLKLSSFRHMQSMSRVGERKMEEEELCPTPAKPLWKLLLNIYFWEYSSLYSHSSSKLPETEISANHLKQKRNGTLSTEKTHEFPPYRLEVLKVRALLWNRLISEWKKRLAQQVRCSLNTSWKCQVQW